MSETSTTLNPKDLVQSPQEVVSEPTPSEAPAKKKRRKRKKPSVLVSLLRKAASEPVFNSYEIANCPTPKSLIRQSVATRPMYTQLIEVLKDASVGNQFEMITPMFRGPDSVSDASIWTICSPSGPNGGWSVLAATPVGRVIPASDIRSCDRRRSLVLTGRVVAVALKPGYIFGFYSKKENKAFLAEYRHCDKIPEKNYALSTFTVVAVIENFKGNDSDLDTGSDLRYQVRSVRSNLLNFIKALIHNAEYVTSVHEQYAQIFSNLTEYKVEGVDFNFDNPQTDNPHSFMARVLEHTAIFRKAVVDKGDEWSGVSVWKHQSPFAVQLVPGDGMDVTLSVPGTPALVFKFSTKQVEKLCEDHRFLANHFNAAIKSGKSGVAYYCIRR